MDALQKIVECLKKHGYDVLFAAYIGSKMRGDFVEGLSDYDIVVVVDGIKRNNIDECIPQGVELILVPREKINWFSGGPLCVDIAFSTPYIDRIGLKEKCLRVIRDNASLSRVKDRLKATIDEVLRNPEEYVDVVGILIYPYLKRLLSLLSIKRGRLVSRQELFEEISRFGVPTHLLFDVYAQYVVAKRGLNKEIKFNVEDIVKLCKAIKKFLDHCEGI
ncbi:hypothetical protein DRP04_09675 [Archaeoglobales archaeon]|nr:MAG: hypothetical protein DRP04_09675 [Archaeoglobales archaeon]